MATTTTTTTIATVALAAGVAAGSLFAAEGGPAPLPLPEVPLEAPRAAERLDHELCNGLDDNWNGVADEKWRELGSRCDANRDRADCGMFVCLPDGSGSACVEVVDGEQIVPRVERCDGLDNDCDTLTDEGFHVKDVCTSGAGECARRGIVVCAEDGLSSVCNAVLGKPVRETGDLCLDGKDNDCNGLPDGFDEESCPGAPKRRVRRTIK